MVVATRRRSLLSGVFSLLLVATVGAPTVAAPVTRWVDDDGRAGSAGCDATKAAPKRIQAAIDASGPGDTIVVCPGVYREELKVAGSRQGLTIRAASPGAARVRPRAVANADLPLMGITGVNGVTVRGLVLQAPTTTPCRRVPTLLRVLDAVGTVVRKTRFEPLGNDTIGPCGYDAGIVVQGASTLFADEVVIRDFRTRGIDSTTPVSEQGPGIHVQDSQLLFLHAAESPKPAIGAEAVALRTVRASTTIFRGNEVRSLRTAGVSTPLLGAAIVVYDVGGPTVDDNTVRYVTWGITVNASMGSINDNDIRFGRRSGEDRSVALKLSGGNLLGVHGNVAHRFGWGIHADGGAHDHLISDNDFRDNSLLDCWDETSGAGTAGTANTWTSNMGFTDSPNGIC